MQKGIKKTDQTLDAKLLSKQSNQTMALNNTIQPTPVVFRGAYELSLHEHQLKNKLHKAMKQKERRSQKGYHREQSMTEISATDHDEHENTPIS